MSYRNTTLIARRGYGNLGYTEIEQKLPWCGNLPANSTQICRSDNNTTGTGFGSNRGTATGGGTGGTLSQIGGGIKDILSGAINAFATAKGTAPVPFQPVSATPTWLMPALLGGGVIVAVLLLRKRGGSAPTSNPARRRRYHRRRR